MPPSDFSCYLHRYIYMCFDSLDVCTEMEVKLIRYIKPTVISQSRPA